MLSAGLFAPIRADAAGEVRTQRDSTEKEIGKRISSRRLLKKVDNKAAGSAATEAYPCGTSQEDGRPRTQ
jgi:hypothetical protein